MTAWPIKTVDEGAVATLTAAFGIHPTLARLLVVRGAATEDRARRFLGSDPADLDSDRVLPDSERAVDRIRTAIRRKEKILVWGHDDLDGATSVAILVDTIERLGGLVSFYIPDKTRAPHGLDRPRLALAGADGVSLVITTDCGVTNVDEVEFAARAGIDVIITDHHELTGDLPAAVAVVDPKRSDSTYPFIELAGAGVALKAAVALLGRTAAAVIAERPELGAWAALGTIADRVRLVEENRVIVKCGLRALAESKDTGLWVLRETIGLPADALTVERIGAEVIPVFTSIEAERTVRFLLEPDRSTAAGFLKGVLERVRDFIVEGQAALAQLERQAYLADNLVVAYDPGIPIRHLGFCATKLRNRFSMAALVMTERGDRWVGELRGFEDDDLLALLKTLARYLVEYGGHKRACGFSIEPDNLEPFLNRAQEFARVNFHPAPSRPNRIADGVLPLAELGSSFRQLAPFGPGNEQPLLVGPVTLLERRDGGWTVADNPTIAVTGEPFLAGITGPVNLLYRFDDLLKVTVVGCSTD